MQEFVNIFGWLDSHKKILFKYITVVFVDLLIYTVPPLSSFKPFIQSGLWLLAYQHIVGVEMTAHSHVLDKQKHSEREREREKFSLSFANMWLAAWMGPLDHHLRTIALDPIYLCTPLPSVSVFSSFLLRWGAGLVSCCCGYSEVTLLGA